MTTKTANKKMTIKKKTNKKTMISLMLASFGLKRVNFSKLKKWIKVSFIFIYLFLHTDNYNTMSV